MRTPSLISSKYCFNMHLTCCMYCDVLLLEYSLHCVKLIWQIVVGCLVEGVDLYHQCQSVS